MEENAFEMSWARMEDRSFFEDILRFCATLPPPDELEWKADDWVCIGCIVALINAHLGLWVAEQKRQGLSPRSTFRPVAVR